MLYEIGMRQYCRNIETFVQHLCVSYLMAPHCTLHLNLRRAHKPFNKFPVTGLERTHSLLYCLQFKGSIKKAAGTHRFSHANLNMTEDPCLYLLALNIDILFLFPCLWEAFA